MINLRNAVKDLDEGMRLSYEDTQQVLRQAGGLTAQEARVALLVRVGCCSVPRHEADLC